MSMLEHAKRELALIDNDFEFHEMILNVVEAFAAYGHSGGSASVAIPMINTLLLQKNLTPLTDDYREWVKHEEYMWQSTRNSEAFSTDRGESYYLVSDPNMVKYFTQHKED